jgi:hypothetical protein
MPHFAAASPEMACGTHCKPAVRRALYQSQTFVSLPWRAAFRAKALEAAVLDYFERVCRRTFSINVRCPHQSVSFYHCVLVPTYARRMQG